MKFVGHFSLLSHNKRLICLQEGYEDHITRMTNSPSIALLLQKTEEKDASVDDFRDLVNSDETWKEAIDCTQSIDNVQR